MLGAAMVRLLHPGRFTGAGFMSYIECMQYGAMPMRLDLRDRAASDSFEFTFDGQTISALAGESIAAALSADHRLALRHTRNGQPRGLHCGMGACFDCIVTVDGRAGVRACLAKAAPGLNVSSTAPSPEALAGLGDLPTSALPRSSVDVLVVGAGPAGARVAASLAEAGAKVLVVDERAEVGGQYYKPLMAAAAKEADGNVGAALPDRQFAEGQASARRLAASGAEVWTGATLWFASAGEGFGIVREEGTRSTATVIEPRFTVLATGASERPCPVPGWTLPGVMTTGGLQGLVRSMRVAPGRRIVIAGSGPLNFQLAAELLKLGIAPLAVVDEGPGPGFSTLPGLMGMAMADTGATLTGLGYLTKLMMARVPIHWNARVREICGGDKIESIRIEKGGKTLTIACDVLAQNAGFIPQAESARQLGCGMQYVDAHVGSVAVKAAPDGLTSVPHVYAIGDGAEIAGAKVAMARAELTAAALRRELGLPADSASAGAMQRLGRAQAFQKALWSVFTQAPFDVKMITDDTVICRCEEVTAGAARKACRSAEPTLATLKRQTRAGMGRCQGRFCVSTLTKLIHAEGGPAPDVAAFFAPRPPARPMLLGAIAAEKPEWGGHRRALPPLNSPRVSLRREPFGVIEADVAVIGAGVVGACVARELALAGEKVVVLDRHEANVQASGANAGSLHVQLLSFDFGQKAQAGGRPAAEVLRIAPASIALWKEIERAAAEDLEMSTPGGLMLAETDAELTFLRQKVALEQSYGIDAEIIGANEIGRLEPHLAPRFIGAAYCRDEGKINPLVATLAVVRLAKQAGARFESFAAVNSLRHDGSRWRIATEAGEVKARRVVNCAGGWASHIAAMATRPIPVEGAPLQMIVTEPGPRLVKHLIAHAGRHLSLKQADTGGLIIGGAWPASMNPETGASEVEMASIEGNAWVAAHVLPAAAAFRIVRVWAAMNINIDGAPILGEMPGAPGFYNCVTSNGYSLAPIVAQITADLMTRGRSDLPSEIFSLARFG